MSYFFSGTIMCDYTESFVGFYLGMQNVIPGLLYRIAKCVIKGGFAF